MMGSVLAATFNVTDPSGDPAVENSLGWAIAQANASPGSDQITIDSSLAGSTITQTRQWPVISDSVTIHGSAAPGVKVDGAGTFNILFVRGDGSSNPPAVHVTINDLTLQNGRAKGGEGGIGDNAGGGGMGAGGAIFVGKNAVVRTSNVSLSGNAAGGGSGGTSPASSNGGGGGGGLNGGNGGDSPSSGPGGGGGGYGTGSDGGNGASVGGKGGGDDGGSGNAGAGGAGGSYSGGGGSRDGGGGDGGFGGGGGGGGAGRVGGQGGFGGGGGGGGDHAPSGGSGFGGGQGTTPASSAPAGFGGGRGPSQLHDRAGGGAGFGGAVFVESGGSIFLGGDAAISGGSVSSGAGGEGALALGSGFYLHGTTGLTFTPGAGDTVTVADVITSDAYAPGYSGNDDPAGDGLDTGVTKTGAGTLVLSGSNSYVGGTHIQQGTIAITADAALGHATSAVTISNDAELSAQDTFSTDRTLTLNNGGTLSADAGHVFTIDGVITGTGGVTKAGAGTVVFNNGGNNYTGHTTISEGRLQLGAADVLSQGLLTIDGAGTLDVAGFDLTLASLSGAAGGQILLGSGDLVVDQGVDTTFGGTVSGQGTFTKTGSGILTVAGALDNAGGVIVNEGTLAAGSDNIFGSGMLTINSGTVALNASDQTVTELKGSGGTLDLGSGSFTLDQNVDTTYAGAITGGGSFVKEGTSTFTYTGTGNATGTIEVAQGSFHLAGDLGSATAMVETGGELYGTGTVGGVHVKGRLAAGTLSPEEIAANNNAPATSGTLTVDGNLIFDPGSVLFGDMALDGNLNKVVVNGTTTINGGTFNILDDDAEFDETATYVLIESSGAITGRFDDLVTDFAFLEPRLAYSTNQVRLTFSIEFEPELYTHNTRQVGSTVASLLEQSTASGRLAQLLEALIELDEAEASQVLWALDAEIYSDATAVARRLLTGGDRLVTNRFVRDPTRRAQFWSDHQYRAVDLGFDGNASSGMSHEHHQLFGADMTVAQAHGHALIGLFGGFTWAELDLDRIDHRASIAGPLIGLYGQWSSGSLMLYGRGSFALPLVQARRRYGTGDMHFAAHGEYRMTAAGGNLGMSYATTARGVPVTPFAELGLYYLKRPAIAEHGADNTGLVLDGGEKTTGDARLGAKVALQPVALDDTWLLKPFLIAAYVRALGKTVDNVGAAFIGATDQPFSSKGVDIGRNSADLAASLELVRTDASANIRLGYGLGLAEHATTHTIALAGSLFW